MMNNMEDSPKLNWTNEVLSDFELGKIRDETASYLFQNIWYDEGKLKEFVDKFDDIFYLSVSPSKIEWYKSYPAIYNILKRYKHTAEWHNLELMIFKQKEFSEEQKQEAIEKLRAMYPWLDIKLDDTKYLYIVGYFGWTAWRTKSYYMEEIKKIYPVKQMN